MIDNFRLFGLEHIISIIIPIIIGIVFIFAAKKYPKNVRITGIVLAAMIIFIRSVRYIFDLQTDRFELLDLLSLHVCHINLILLVICLIWPNRRIFTFNFLIGIPTALAVALMPGQVHPDPGMARAIFFIMSHMMLVVGAIYLLVIHKFKITKKDLLFYYIFILFGIIAIYIFNMITGANFMYLMQGPASTVLGDMYSLFGPFLYVCMIYVILASLVTVLYYAYRLIEKITSQNLEQSP